MAKSKARLTEDSIFDFLGGPTRNSKSKSTGDPIVPTRITVTLDELRPYDLNPRKSDNPKYDEIRDSIEAGGLKNPPTITRRHPDDTEYSIREGGNTRLKALWELYLKYKELAEKAKTDNERQQYLLRADSFYRHELLFVPFTDDVQALSDHMVENEVRGGTKFIERALVVDQYIKLFKEQDEAAAADAGQAFKYKPLSSRKLAERISSYGWVVRHDDVLRYQYAITLLEYIPTALWGGAGNKVIRSINSLNKSYRALWKANTDRPQEELDSLFYDVLAECDSEAIDIQDFTTRLNRTLAPVFDTNESVIALEITAITEGRSKASKLADHTREHQGKKSSKPGRNSGSGNKSRKGKPDHSDLDSLFSELRVVLDDIVDKVGDIGLEISDPNIDGILFHNLAVFENKDSYPRPDVEGDTERAATWWHLLKTSRVAFTSECKGMKWDQLVSEYLMHFLAQNNYSLALTIIWIESQLALNPELYDACQRVTALVAQYTSQQSME